MKLRSGSSAPLTPVGDGFCVVVEELVVDGIPAPAKGRLAGALADFQKFYAPALDDALSFMARVFRTVTPELVRPEALAEVERRVSNSGTRAALTALGARTTLMAPVIDLARPERARAVLITAMSSSGRTVNEDDLADLAQFARDLSPRLHW